MKVLTERFLRKPVLKFLKVSNDFSERSTSGPREANKGWIMENVIAVFIWVSKSN